MTELLQTEDDIILDSESETDIDETKPEITETSESELATETDDKQDKTNDGAQKAINKQHAKYREEERKRIEVEKEAKELREKLAAFESAKVETDIPPIPDPYDDDYEDKIKARDEAITRKASQEAQKSFLTEQQNAQKETAKKTEQERINTLISGYDKHTVTLGLNPSDVAKAGNKVVEYGISGEVAEFILEQEDGPLITTYLSENPILLDELRHMTPIQAAFKVSSDIRAAASGLKPQASTAPDPVEILTGRGAGETEDPLLKGATFE